jgi:Trypsin
MSKVLFVSFGAVLAVSSLVALGCASADPPSGEKVDAASPDGFAADVLEIVPGVPDRGRDPAVVAIDVGGEGLCTGTLIAPNVVLTARHCVARTSESVACPSTVAQVHSQRPAATLGIYVGDDVVRSEFVAVGREIVVPAGQTLCGADIALVLLDRNVAGVSPVPLRTKGVVKGERVRAVGFGKRGDNDPAGVKLLRDHVAVLDVTRAEFQVGEATCQGDSGGPALDSKTGELVGVVSRGGPSCEGKDVHNIYTRVDVFLPLIHAALQQAAQPIPPPGSENDDADEVDVEEDAGSAVDGAVVSPVSADASAKPPKAKKSKPVTDMGEACATGAECSTGVCVREADGTPSYCSRTCGAKDRCPTHHHCTKVTNGSSVCVATE